jgi:hypothetical protein
MSRCATSLRPGRPAGGPASELWGARPPGAPTAAGAAAGARPRRRPARPPPEGRRRASPRPTRVRSIGRSNPPSHPQTRATNGGTLSVGCPLARGPPRAGAEGGLTAAAGMQPHANPFVLEDEGEGVHGVPPGPRPAPFEVEQPIRAEVVEANRSAKPERRQTLDAFIGEDKVGARRHEAPPAPIGGLLKSGLRPSLAWPARGPRRRGGAAARAPPGGAAAGARAPPLRRCCCVPRAPRRRARRPSPPPPPPTPRVPTRPRQPPAQEIRSFEGFYAPADKQLLFYALGVLTCGLVFLLAKWSPRVHIALNLRRCALRDATFVRITVRRRRGGGGSWEGRWRFAAAAAAWGTAGCRGGSAAACWLQPPAPRPARAQSFALPADPRPRPRSWTTAASTWSQCQRCSAPGPAAAACPAAAQARRRRSRSTASWSTAATGLGGA